MFEICYTCLVMDVTTSTNPTPQMASLSTIRLIRSRRQMTLCTLFVVICFSLIGIILARRGHARSLELQDALNVLDKYETTIAHAEGFACSSLYSHWMRLDQSLTPLGWKTLPKKCDKPAYGSVHVACCIAMSATAKTILEELGFDNIPDDSQKILREIVFILHSGSATSTPNSMIPS